MFSLNIHLNQLLIKVKMQNLSRIDEFDLRTETTLEAAFPHSADDVWRSAFITLSASC